MVYVTDGTDVNVRLRTTKFFFFCHVTLRLELLSSQALVFENQRAQAMVIFFSTFLFILQTNEKTILPALRVLVVSLQVSIVWI